MQRWWCRKRDALNFIPLSAKNPLNVALIIFNAFWPSIRHLFHTIHSCSFFIFLNYFLLHLAAHLCTGQNKQWRIPCNDRYRVSHTRLHMPRIYQHIAGRQNTILLLPRLINWAAAIQIAAHPGRASHNFVIIGRLSSCKRESSNGCRLQRIVNKHQYMLYNRCNS